MIAYFLQKNSDLEASKTIVLCIEVHVIVFLELEDPGAPWDSPI